MRSIVSLEPSMVARCLTMVSLSTITLFSSAVLACNDHASGKEAKKATAVKESAWVAGEVRDVDLDEGTITLAHDRIDALRMKRMSSMLIKAENANIIVGTRPGDKVRFRVRLVNSQPVLTQLTATN